MNKPSWDSAPEWANYLAMDEDGTWWWYQNEPVPISDSRNIWASGNGVSEHRVDEILRGYAAQYRELDGKLKSFYFGFNRYGSELALLLAETTRDFHIRKLNEQGAGYA